MYMYMHATDTYMHVVHVHSCSARYIHTDSNYIYTLQALHRHNSADNYYAQLMYAYTMYGGNIQYACIELT